MKPELLPFVAQNLWKLKSDAVPSDLKDTIIITMITGMDLKEQLVIWKRAEYLIDNMAWTSKLQDRLVHEGVLTAPMVADIEVGRILCFNIPPARAIEGWLCPYQVSGRFSSLLLYPLK